MCPLSFPFHHQAAHARRRKHAHAQALHHLAVLQPPSPAALAAMRAWLELDGMPWDAVLAPWLPRVLELAHAAVGRWATAADVDGDAGEEEAQLLAAASLELLAGALNGWMDGLNINQQDARHRQDPCDTSWYLLILMLILDACSSLAHCVGVISPSEAGEDGGPAFGPRKGAAAQEESVRWQRHRRRQSESPHTHTVFGPRTRAGFFGLMRTRSDCGRSTLS